MRSARSGSSLIATIPRCARGTRPKWMVSGSPRLRPSATLTGSTSPIMSATEVSGVASFSTNRSDRCRQTIGSSSPWARARACAAAVIGWKGSSDRSVPAIAGDHSSSRAVSARSSRDLPCPRSPSSTMSWPAMRARSTCGRTVSPRPWRPGHGSAPVDSAASRFPRSSSRSERVAIPAARRPPSVVIVGCGEAEAASKVVTPPR